MGGTPMTVESGNHDWLPSGAKPPQTGNSLPEAMEGLHKPSPTTTNGLYKLSTKWIV